jgi:hypothetical protein
MSSRSDSGSLDPPAWFCSSVKRPTVIASESSRLSRYRTWAFVRFSSLLTKTIAETQNSLPLCCLRRSRMISASPMYACGAFVAGSLPVRTYTPAFSHSSRARSWSSSVRGAARALPVQLEISAVRRPLASPWGRNSLMVADGMRSLVRVGGHWACGSEYTSATRTVRGWQRSRHSSAGALAHAEPVPEEPRRYSRKLHRIHGSPSRPPRRGWAADGPVPED